MARYEDLSGKRVVITGGASGIGLATAQRFVREGSRVVIVDIDEKGIAAAKTALPGLIGGVRADVGSPGGVREAFGVALEQSLGQDPETIAGITAFFGSELGQRILGLAVEEVEAAVREAMAELRLS